MSIELEGIDALLAKIDTLAKLRFVANAVKLAALHIKGQIAQYPPASRRPQPFKTDKARRYFFWALGKGEIDVPYRRGVSPKSETLGRRWTISTRDAGLTAVIGNNTSYGQLVQGPGRQAQYHKITGWKTTEQVVAEEREFVTRMLREEISKAVGE